MKYRLAAFALALAFLAFIAYTASHCPDNSPLRAPDNLRLIDPPQPDPPATW